MYAIHISDLSEAKQTAPLVIDVFLRPDYLTDHPSTVRVGNDIDEDAVVLDGPATYDDDRMNACIDLLLGIIGQRTLGRKFRVYKRGTRGGWTKL